MTKLKIVDTPVSDDKGFSLTESSEGVTVDELSVNAMGGTEMMKYGLYERLSKDIRDEVQIICSRVREVDTHRPSILWLHDMFNDPEAVHLKDQESRDRFSKLIFVSNWQWTTYNLAMGIPFSQAMVLRNAIEPIPDHKKSRDGTIRLIYHTTPHRGLEILVPVFEQICAQLPTLDIHLDVFSSFEAYGWPQRDEPYQELFNRIRNHPNMTYHGYQPNDVVRKALQEAHIFAYPSIWQETSCIAAIEAMSAGCSIVCPNYGALPETTGNFAFSYQWMEDINSHANVFANVLISVIQSYRNNFSAIEARTNFAKTWTDNFFSWDNRILEWEGLIKGILEHKKRS